MNIEPALVALSLYGAWAITTPYAIRLGFFAWIVADVGWVIVFAHQDQGWPAVLFLVYTLLAIKGALRK